VKRRECLGLKLMGDGSTLSLWRDEFYPINYYENQESTQSLVQNDKDDIIKAIFGHLLDSLSTFVINTPDEIARKKNKEETKS